MKTKGRAIWAAYNDTGALGIDCPHCDAEKGTWCTKDDGRVARVPCVDRIAATAAVSPVARLPSTVHDEPVTTTDFSEPRHPNEEDQ